MKKRTSVILAWFLAGVGALMFFLPWVKPVAPSKLASPLEVARQLRTEEDSFLDSWIGMKKGEWLAFGQRPTIGLSGFQLLLLGSDAGAEAKEARAWLDAVFGEGRTLGPAVTVIPLVLLLLTAAFMSPRKPLRQLFGVGGILLLVTYIWARWRLNVISDQRVVVQMELAYGLWITLYTMLAMAVLTLVRFLSPKGKW